MQKKRGNLRHALLDSAYRASAARIAQIDLVRPTPILLTFTVGLAHWRPQVFSESLSCGTSESSQLRLMLAVA